jgi:hypothetical protein
MLVNFWRHQEKGGPSQHWRGHEQGGALEETHRKLVPLCCWVRRGCTTVNGETSDDPLTSDGLLQDRRT